MERTTEERRDLTTEEARRVIQEALKSADEARKVIYEALKGWERSCPECEYHKAGGCTQWECVVENKRIAEAFARAKAVSGRVA